MGIWFDKYLIWICFLIGVFAGCNVCMVVAQVGQLFVDTDANTDTGYGRQGANVVCRLTLPGEPWPPSDSGGWGPVIAEGYVDGEIQEWCPCRYLTFNFVTFDSDFDGDVDLNDYAAFQRAMEMEDE